MQNLMLKVLVALMALTVAGYAVCVGESPQSKVAMRSMTVADLEKAGDDCRAQKDYVQASNYFREAIRKDKKNAKLYNKLGLSELKNNDLREARAGFMKAAKYDRKYPEALEQHWSCLLRREELRASCQVFQESRGPR